MPATQIPAKAEERSLEATRSFHRLQAFARGEEIDDVKDTLRTLVRVLLKTGLLNEDVLAEIAEDDSP